MHIYTSIELQKIHTSTNAHRGYLYHLDAGRSTLGETARGNKMTFLIPRRAHRTPTVQQRSIGRHGSIHVYSGDDCACDFIDDEPMRRDPKRRDATTKRRADDLAVDTSNCE